MKTLTNEMIKLCQTKCHIINKTLHIAMFHQEINGNINKFEDTKNKYSSVL